MNEYTATEKMVNPPE